MQLLEIQEDTTPENGHLEKPEGGYVQVPTLTIAILWWAYAKGLLSLRGVRVGLALFELRIRRAAFVWTEKKRGNPEPEFTPNYSTKELGDYCGLPEKRARAALKELLALGLVSEFSEKRIVFAPSLESVAPTLELRSEFRAWFSLLTKRKRVPVPRRILALAAESSSPALIAVILGACLRCVYFKPEKGFTYSGRLSCSWLSARFGLSLRAVQSAKEHLVALGWIERHGDINRFGERLTVNPEWHRLAALPEIEREKHQDRAAGATRLLPLASDAPEVADAGATLGNLPLLGPAEPDACLEPLDIGQTSDTAGNATVVPVVLLDTTPPAGPLAPETRAGGEPPPVATAGTNSAGVTPSAGTNSAGFSLIRESLPSEESKYQRESRAERPEALRQQPDASEPGGLGIYSSKGRNKNQDQPATSLPPPRLSSIRPEDFSDLGRALELFRQAVKCGLMPNASEHSRLRWLAAIERARTVPSRNPAGVFLFLVKGKHWDYLSDGHVHGANDRLKAHLFGRPPENPSFFMPGPLIGSLPQAIQPRPQLSRDALLVQVVRAELMKRGSRLDAFMALRSQAGWDRPRYDAALAELVENQSASANRV
jgi:hypothetical protein